MDKGLLGFERRVDSTGGPPGRAADRPATRSETAPRPSPGGRPWIGDRLRRAYFLFPLAAVPVLVPAGAEPVVDQSVFCTSVIPGTSNVNACFFAK